MATSNAPNRDAGNFRRFITEMRHVQTETIDGNQVSSKGNVVSIDYNARSDIIISLQDVIGDSETLIFVKANRVNITGRYSIMRGDLIEHPQRSATGRTTMSVAHAQVHILIVVEGLFDCLAALQLNRERYFMEWMDIVKDNYVRKAVWMSTKFGYERRCEAAGCVPIGALKEYFGGPRKIEVVAPLPIEPTAAPNICEAAPEEIGNELTTAADDIKKEIDSASECDAETDIKTEIKDEVIEISDSDEEGADADSVKHEEIGGDDGDGMATASESESVDDDKAGRTGRFRPYKRPAHLDECAASTVDRDQ